MLLKFGRVVVSDDYRDWPLPPAAAGVAPPLYELSSREQKLRKAAERARERRANETQEEAQRR